MQPCNPVLGIAAQEGDCAAPGGGGKSEEGASLAPSLLLQPGWGKSEEGASLAPSLLLQPGWGKSEEGASLAPSLSLA